MQNAYPEYENSLFSGFRDQIDITNLKGGWHSITVKTYVEEKINYSYVGINLFYKKD